jgi:hypothetical protein
LTELRRQFIKSKKAAQTFAFREQPKTQTNRALFSEADMNRRQRQPLRDRQFVCRIARFQARIADGLRDTRFSEALTQRTRIIHFAT